MLFIKYLLFFFVDKNQILFELENIYIKQNNLCFKKNSQIYLEKYYNLFFLNYPRFILKRYFKLIIKT